MDVNKDGSIDKSDLRAAFDNVGKLMDESELDSMLSEVGGGCTFDNMVKMFQEKMAGGKSTSEASYIYFFVEQLSKFQFTKFNSEKCETKIEKFLELSKIGSFPTF